LERLGVAADDTVFIDDQPANVEGAERVGMKTILFTTNSQFEVELAALESAANA
jgi:2-haloacid dehalogenase